MCLRYDQGQTFELHRHVLATRAYSVCIPSPSAPLRWPILPSSSPPSFSSPLLTSLPLSQSRSSISPHSSRVQTDLEFSIQMSTKPSMISNEKGKFLPARLQLSFDIGCYTRFSITAPELQLSCKFQPSFLAISVFVPIVLQFLNLSRQASASYNRGWTSLCGYCVSLVGPQTLLCVPRMKDPGEC